MPKAKPEARCPHCGYCPHCGHSNQTYRLAPYSPYPYHPYPYQPYWLYPNWVGSITFSNDSNNQFTLTSGVNQFTLTSGVKDAVQIS